MCTPTRTANRSTFDGKTYNKFVYNDGDGSTGYDVEYPIQLASMDGAFHDASRDVQPLPFANMLDTYSMMNGRGYPETADPRGNSFPPPPSRADQNTSSQPLSSLITATQNQTILLRISNLSTTTYYTSVGDGLADESGGDRRPYPAGARRCRNLYYDSNSITLGGGEAVDVLIDTRGVDAGHLLPVHDESQLSEQQQRRFRRNHDGDRDQLTT